MSAIVHAQAKLNLHLAILARETSGYHAIETVLHRITLSDVVTVKLAPADMRKVVCSVDVGSTEQNLAYRAAMAYLEAAVWTTGFEIHIEKRIPAGGGLGGGSADAAAVLRALDALAPKPLAPTHLLALAATLGADVPFLASDASAALAWGRGTRMLALDALPTRDVALIIPPFGIATADAYAGIAAARSTRESGAAPPIALHAWHLHNWAELAPWAYNDFQPVVASQYPVIDIAIRALRSSGATLAALTGSGSTVFGIFDAPPDPAALKTATGCEVILTQTAGGVEAVRLID